MNWMPPSFLFDNHNRHSSSYEKLSFAEIAALGQSNISADAMNFAWCMNETFHWQARSVDAAQARSEYDHYNKTRESTFIFSLKDGLITLLNKPLWNAPLSYGQQVLLDRASKYLHFLQSAVEINPNIRDGMFAIEVGDGPLNSESAPVFSFQKTLGDTSILLNDVNFIEGDFYSIPPFDDRVSFSEKINLAVFVGSTTGMHNDLASVHARSNPRVAAALFFKNVPNVDFRLPNIVQSDPDAEDLLKSMGFGQTGHMSWPDQFRYKYLISMDGNGATCQRIAVALMSKSVLMKYASLSQLYYFSGLVPWNHYVPIASNQDVVHVLEIADRNPEQFQAIADNGRLFSERYLNKSAGLSYASQLLQIYMNLFR